jgi:hypothetical protein
VQSIELPAEDSKKLLESKKREISLREKLANYEI